MIRSALIMSLLLVPAAAYAGHRDSGESISIGYSSGWGDSWMIRYSDNDRRTDHGYREYHDDRWYGRNRVEYRYRTYWTSNDRRGWRRADHHDHASQRGRDRRSHYDNHRREQDHRRRY